MGRGTVEVPETDVSPATPARLVRVLVDEGDVVATGDTLATLTRATLAPSVARDEARVAAAEATLRDLESGARSEELRGALAELSGSDAEYERTARDLKRARSLAEAGAVSTQALDLAETAAEAAMSRRDAAHERLELLRKGTRPDQVRKARAELATAQAQLSGAQAEVADLVLTAPAPGRVLDRYAEPGEVLAAGEPVLTLGAIHRPRVRAWLPERVVASLRLGQEVTVSLDGAPGRTFPGTISFISPRAEFTPRVALTEDERADLMFAIRVDVRDTTGLVKPGLSATVRFEPLP
jgi:HlyD family secretion protein